MKITINGKECEFMSGTTISDCIKHFNFDPQKIVVEKNLEIINKDDFEKSVLNENDRLEILRFVGGG